MAFYFGTHSEFDDAVTYGDPVVAVAAKAVELARNKGAFYQALKAPQIGIDTESFEIYSRSKTAREGVVGGTAWNNSDTTGLTVSPAVAKGLTVGHVLKIENEVVVVKSVDRSANTIDVYARGAGGTTAAGHAIGTEFKVIGFAGKDSTLKYVESFFENTGKYENHIQTIFETLDYELKGKILKRKGLAGNIIDTILTKEAAHRVAELLALTAIHGVKQAGSKSGSPSMTAGLISQLQDNASGNRPILRYNSNGGFTETKLRAALKELVKTGTPTTIWCDASNKEVINGFNSALTTSIPRTEHTAGQYVNSYDYDGLILEVKVDSDMPSSNIAVVNQNKCYKSWLKGDALRKETEPAKSSREFRESLQGSVGIIIEDVGYEHIDIYNIS